MDVEGPWAMIGWRFRAFGFEMDCGHSFSNATGLMLGNERGLTRVLRSIDDVKPLGDAAFSQCHYITHCSFTPERNDVDWIASVLGHMEELAPPALAGRPGTCGRPLTMDNPVVRAPSALPGKQPGLATQTTTPFSKPFPMVELKPSHFETKCWRFDLPTCKYRSSVSTRKNTHGRTTRCPQTG